MLISHRKKFIFTKTAKTAGTSIESYYEPFCMPKGQWTQLHSRDEYISETGIIGFRGENHKECTYFNHMSADKIKESVGEEIWKSYFKFTVVRNPFSKLISGWYHFHKPHTTMGGRVKFALQRPMHIPLIIFGKRDIYDFRNWILNGGRIIDRDKYILDGKECMDYFIKYETLIDDLEVINKKLDIESDELILPKFKAGIRNNRFETRDFYDRKTENIVREIYQWEFERFGYEMP